MFNIGFSELIVILLIAFIIVGPSDLPKVARMIAKLYKKARSLWDEILAAINLESEIENIKDTKKDLDRTIKEANPMNIVKKEIEEVTKSVREVKKEVEDPLPKQ